MGDGLLQQTVFGWPIGNHKIGWWNDCFLASILPFYYSCTQKKMAEPYPCHWEKVSQWVQLSKCVISHAGQTNLYWETEMLGSTPKKVFCFCFNAARNGFNPLPKSHRRLCILQWIPLVCVDCLSAVKRYSQVILCDRASIIAVSGMDLEYVTGSRPTSDQILCYMESRLLPWI